MRVLTSKDLPEEGAEVTGRKSRLTALTPAHWPDTAHALCPLPVPGLLRVCLPLEQAVLHQQFLVTAAQVPPVLGLQLPTGAQKRFVQSLLAAICTSDVHFHSTELLQCF